MVVFLNLNFFFLIGFLKLICGLWGLFDGQILSRKTIRNLSDVFFGLDNYLGYNSVSVIEKKLLVEGLIKFLDNSLHKVCVLWELLFLIDDRLLHKELLLGYKNIFLNNNNNNPILCVFELGEIINAWNTWLDELPIFQKLILIWA